jgi:hypothetical protein
MKPITQAMRLERRKAAEERQAAYNALSRKEKLAKLDETPTRNAFTARRQRAKLENSR